MQQETQTQTTNIQQDTTVNKVKTQDKMNQHMDETIKVSTDSDSTVADSGSSGSSES